MLKPEYDNTENVRIIIYGFWIVKTYNTGRSDYKQII
jgi:hypothetical protein